MVFLGRCLWGDWEVFWEFGRIYGDVFLVFEMGYSEITN
jgi:hypothetical protein